LKTLTTVLLSAFTLCPITQCQICFNISQAHRGVHSCRASPEVAGLAFESAISLVTLACGYFRSQSTPECLCTRVHVNGRGGRYAGGTVSTHVCDSVCRCERVHVCVYVGLCVWVYACVAGPTRARARVCVCVCVWVRSVTSKECRGGPECLGARTRAYRCMYVSARGREEVGGCEDACVYLGVPAHSRTQVQGCVRDRDGVCLLSG